jgi:hypothetical protein
LMEHTASLGWAALNHETDIIAPRLARLQAALGLADLEC